jgi:hypothetical protein
MLERIRLSVTALMPIVAMFAVALARRWWQ